ncbi:MAG: polysaccharide biosynthesis/export family protein [Candidatus Sulfotelmatobacter sp.]
MQRIPDLLFRLLSLAVVPAVLGFLQVVAFAQNSNLPQDLGHEAPAQEQDPINQKPVPSVQPPTTAEKTSRIESNPTALVLGPGDEMDVAVYGAPDLSGHTRVSSDGNISMPLVGYIHVAGLTSSEAEGTIESHLRQNNIVNDPQVSIFVKDYNSSGAQMAQNNVDIQPGDTVVVPAGAIVYVLGEVSKPGGYVLGSSSGVTVLRVVAAAGGPTRDASVGGARMIRRTPNGLQQIPVPLKNLLRAKTADIPLQADDILFVPNSRFKELVNAGALVTGLGTVALYRIP